MNWNVTAIDIRSTEKLFNEDVEAESEDGAVNKLFSNAPTEDWDDDYIQVDVLNYRTGEQATYMLFELYTVVGEDF